MGKSFHLAHNEVLAALYPLHDQTSSTSLTVNAQLANYTRLNSSLGIMFHKIRPGVWNKSSMDKIPWQFFILHSQCVFKHCFNPLNTFIKSNSRRIPLVLKIEVNSGKALSNKRSFSLRSVLIFLAFKQYKCDYGLWSQNSLNHRLPGGQQSHEQ